MAEVLHELLLSQSSVQEATALDAGSSQYLEGLTSRSLSALEADEPQAHAQGLHSSLLSLRSLCKRSHKSIVNSADRHSLLRQQLHIFSSHVKALRETVPAIESAAVEFTTAFGKSQGSKHLDRRRKALLLSRNCERVVDILGLPDLLSSATPMSSASSVNSSSALDLNTHITRLHSLYPESALVSAVLGQASQAMQDMASKLIVSLRPASLKLAAATRAVSWLRRIILEIGTGNPGSNNLVARERCLVSLFLVCRAATLVNMLAALDPLRVLADQEGARSRADLSHGTISDTSHHTERYLKRYIEIFREHSYGIVSMSRSIFPQAHTADEMVDSMHSITSPISTFALYLTDMLVETLQQYLGTIQEQSAYDSIVTQAIYCAGSLGRLGGDFGVSMAGLEGMRRHSWADAVKRHRSMASRLQSLAGKKGQA